MKKICCVLITVMILVSVMLTSCTSSVPFNTSDVATAARLDGIKELSAGTTAKTAIDSLTGVNKPSGYYISKSKEDAQKIYNDYLNRNAWYPKANINEIIVVASKEPIGEAVYQTDCCLFFFSGQLEAKSYYDTYVSGLESKHTNKTGYKNGYAYAITYSLSANRNGNCDWMKGVYLRGNSVLVISGYSPIDGPDTFSDVIYKQLGLADPSTLKK